MQVRRNEFSAFLGTAAYAGDRIDGDWCGNVWECMGNYGKVRGCMGYYIHAVNGFPPR